ncbi:hypothetical protein EPI10_032121 [Gossypium australe]|uniref:Retrotransposon gag domain-containing protein n=1 Tax=Gossypium australe TaxID=47621 RepID=A0A5B6X3E7_9ROSI|nr:hypothetical protein EPI10_032121 [Gossypium australe]
MTPDRITLQNMKKKPNESFRQYAQRWREVAIQAQPPLLEKETIMLFINTLKALFIYHMLGSATRSFSDVVMTGEMIENAIRSGRIEAGENAKRSAPRKKENEVNNANLGYSKSITGSSRQESGRKQNVEKIQFTLIPMTYKELYQSLFDAQVVAPFYLKPLHPPYPKWYDANAQCEYHTGITGHSIENYTTFKKLVERFIQMGIVKFDNAPSAENPLPNHIDNRVNKIDGTMGRRIKTDIAEVKTPLKWVWKEMAERGLVTSNPEGSYDKMGNYCEFHHEMGHRIQECE